MSNAKHGYGTTLTKGVTVIAEINSIGGLDLSADTIDVTTLSSADAYKEFIQGMKDAGEVSINGFFYPGDTGQAAVLTDYNSGATDTYIITFPTTIGATWTFTAFPIGFSTGEIDPDNGVPFEATFKVTGKPNLGVTASGGLTALALTGTGTLTPAFDNAIYYYTHAYTTAASITVTPTAASHTIKLYIDNVFVQNVVSGAASSAITISTGASKKISLVVYEAAKTPKTYEIIATKTA